MAIQHKTDQQVYLNKGPLDAKQLKKTYAELLKVDNWTYDNKFTAYNGMIVAVWLDTTKNGIYYLFDSTITSAFGGNPDVTNPNNWHRLSDAKAIDGLEGQIADLALQAEGFATALADNNTTIVALAANVKTNTEAIAKLNGTGDGSVQKIVADAIAEIPVLGIASTLTAGIVKASEEIIVAEDGTMELGVVSTDKLVEGTKTLVLNGGNSSEASA
jgi:hypothetical protein